MMMGPGGEPGLPVCAACLFAIQFYPLATLKVSGRPLFWWTPQHEWMFELARAFAVRVEQLVEGSPDEVPNLSWASTRLIEEVSNAFADKGDGLPIVDLVGCHSTNYGSGPDYEEIRLRRGVLGFGFLKTAQQYPAYRAIRDSAWENTRGKKGKGNAEQVPPQVRRNFLYEELGSQFTGVRSKRGSLISRFFRPFAGKEPGVFELCSVYARKVLDMTQEQVDAVKELANQIAASGECEDYLRQREHRPRIPSCGSMRISIDAGNPGGQRNFTCR